LFVKRYLWQRKKGVKSKTSNLAVSPPKGLWGGGGGGQKTRNKVASEKEISGGAALSTSKEKKGGRGWGPVGRMEEEAKPLNSDIWIIRGGCLKARWGRKKQ